MASLWLLFVGKEYTFSKNNKFIRLKTIEEDYCMFSNSQNLFFKSIEQSRIFKKQNEIKLKFNNI